MTKRKPQEPRAPDRAKVEKIRAELDSITERMEDLLDTTIKERDAINVPESREKIWLRNVSKELDHTADRLTAVLQKRPAKDGKTY